MLSKNVNIKMYRTIVSVLFCVGLKLGHSHYGTNTDWDIQEQLLRRVSGPKW